MREGEYGAVLGDQIEGGVAHRACCPLPLNESFARMRNEGGGFAAFFRGWYPRIAAFPSRGRCPAGADRAQAA